MHVKVGLFGGSFNPIHRGHLFAAEAALAALQLDQMWWIPNRYNPLKGEESDVDSAHRLKMVELAIAPYPRYQLCDLECKRSGPSFTVDTLEELRRRHPDVTLFLLIGSDTIADLHRWKNIDKIFDLTNIALIPRNGEENNLHLSNAQQRALKAHRVDLATMPISSTQVRAQLKERRLPVDLLTQEVLDYIKANALYSSFD